MEIKIGLQCAPRELVLQTAVSAHELQQELRDALAEERLAALTDDNGSQVLIAADKIVYIEIGQPGARRVGFGH